MADMVIGLFNDQAHADMAVEELQSVGYNPKEISIIAQDRYVSHADAIEGTKGGAVVQGMMSGATTGGLIGGIAGLLIGIGAIAIPGIGGLLITGPLAAAFGLTGAAAATFSGAITGALAGGLIGGLVNLGIPEEDARYYEQRIKEGAILLAVPTLTRQIGDAQDVLERHGAYQVKSFAVNV